MILLALAACDDPACDSGFRFDPEGLCVTDTGHPAESQPTGESDTPPADSSDETGVAHTGDSVPDSGDPADTGDSGDTAESPAATMEFFDVSSVVGETTTWYGLSVAADGIVWAATSIGLVRFDPTAATARLYGVSDGLYLTSTRSVLAHSDGSLWVGYAGDVAHQGDQFAVAADGSITSMQIVDFTESSEILQVHRMGEQPFGAGTGDVWMGTNEGLCLYDANLGVFSEHAHPVHPHLLSRGVAFTSDDNIWNGDEYQVSRWNYSDDGDLNPSADLAEYWTPWPVSIGVDPVEIVDTDAMDANVWLASSLYGVAHVAVSSTLGASTTTLYTEPAEASAVRALDENTVFIGTSSGLWTLDVATDATVAANVDYPLDQPIQQLCRDTSGADDAMWMAIPGALLRITGVPLAP